MTELSKSSEEPTPKPDEVEPVGGLAPKPEKESAAQPEASGEPEAEPVVKLAEPSKELATRLLGKVSFQERLVGTKIHSSAGSLSRSIYSFEEAVDFLHVNVEGVMARGSSSAGYIDTDVLKKWVGETLGDTELAEAIEVKVKTGSNYKERILPVKRLMKQRLEQCKELLGIVGEETQD